MVFFWKHLVPVDCTDIGVVVEDAGDRADADTAGFCDIFDGHGIIPLWLSETGFVHSENDFAFLHYTLTGQKNKC